MDQSLSRELNILIIDEQALAQNYLRFALEKLGYGQVQFTDRAQTALQFCKERQFDLIICSFNLQQGKDGYQFYEEVKVRRLQSLNTGFIFISAETDPSLVYSVLELQPDEFLAKPYTIRDLQTRIERVLKRKKLLKPINQWLELARPDRALKQLEQMLAAKPDPKFAPILLRMKGDILLEQANFAKAQQFYRSVLAAQPLSWARIGLIKSLLACGEQEAADQELQKLETKGENKLFIMEQLAELEFRRQDYELAQQHLEQAIQLAPRNLFRQQKLQQLSRINHDYERQYKTARDMVKFARFSMYEQPELYLNLARACIDYAASIDEDAETNKLSKQASDCLSNIRNQFPEVNVTEQQQVIQARLHNLKEQKEKASQILTKLDHDNFTIDNFEDVLDKAKALHEVGFTQLSNTWFDRLALYCQQQNADPFLQTYVQQERSERAELSMPPKELNNIAVQHFQHGNWQAAMAAFSHAFRLLPRNTGIALNLLQCLLTAPSLNPTEQAQRQPLIQSCLKAIQKGKLNPEQQRRFEQLQLKYPTRH